MNPDLSPRHPENEGAVIALFLFTITGFASLFLYVWGRALTG